MTLRRQFNGPCPQSDRLHGGGRSGTKAQERAEVRGGVESLQSEGSGRARAGTSENDLGRVAGLLPQRPRHTRRSTQVYRLPALGFRRGSTAACCRCSIEMAKPKTVTPEVSQGSTGTRC